MSTEFPNDLYSPAVQRLIEATDTTSGRLSRLLQTSLAWHVSAFAAGVHEGDYRPTHANANAYLDEVCLGGRLEAKRPSAAAFTKMVRGELEVLRNSQKDCETLPLFVDQESAFSVPPRSMSPIANDNARKG